MLRGTESFIVYDALSLTIILLPRRIAGGRSEPDGDVGGRRDRRRSYGLESIDGRLIRCGALQQRCEVASFHRQFDAESLKRMRCRAGPIIAAELAAEHCHFPQAIDYAGWRHRGQQTWGEITRTFRRKQSALDDAVANDHGQPHDELAQVVVRFLYFINRLIHN